MDSIERIYVAVFLSVLLLMLILPVAAALEYLTGRDLVENAFAIFVIALCLEFAALLIFGIYNITQELF